jgi:hypothetical protein
MADPGAGAYHLHVSGFGSALVAETALVRHRAFADVAGAAPEFAPVSLSCSRMNRGGCNFGFTSELPGCPVDAKICNHLLLPLCATRIEARPRCLKWSI